MEKENCAAPGLLDDLGAKTARAQEQAREAAELLNACLDDFAALCPQTGAESHRQMAALSAALASLRQSLASPVLRIAAIGTTSSAKSTLLNLLAGHDLLPTDVQEKSAGAVRIIHSPRPGLTIEESAGSLWASGDIEVENAQDIREALEIVMDAYRAAVRDGAELEAPSFIVRHPLDLPGLLDLPPGFQVELMDLPGLRYTGDFRNRQVMARCRDALCLVAYDGQETDSIKQEVLLDDVMSQLQAIGSPLSRMLFTATRVDAFLLHSGQGWPENERRFLEERREAIAARLAEEFPQATGEDIAMTSISPLPAFYAMRLYDPDQRDDAWKNIKRSFLGLVEGGRNGDPDQGVDLAVDLKPAYRMWDDDDWGLIIGQLRETTHLNDFVADLESHIHRNFAAIVLPPATGSFVESARNIAEWLATELEFARNSMESEFAEQKRRLEEAVARLDGINQRCSKELENFLNLWLAAVFGTKNAKADAAEFEDLASKFPAFMSPGLASLADWSRRVEKAYTAPVEAVIARLVKNVPLPPSLPDKAALERCCMLLARKGYSGQKAFNGVHRMSQDDRDYKLFQTMVEAYNKLGAVCAKSAQKSMEECLLFQTDRLLDCLNELQNACLAWLDAECDREIPREFKEVARITPNALRKYMDDFKLDSPFRFKTAILNGERVDKISVKDNKSSIGFAPLDALVDCWNHIWGRDKIQEIVRIMQHKLYLPSARNLLQEAQKTYKSRADRINMQMADFAREQMLIFLEDIRACQKQRLSAYEQKLNALMREQRLGREQGEAQLTLINEKLQKAALAMEGVGQAADGN